MSNELTTLSTLAAEINIINEQVEHHKNQAVVYAARCGEKLLLAKAQCKHGEFQQWIEKNCRVSYRHAANFMKLAKKYPELLDTSKVQSIALLPNLTQAIYLLDAPEEVKAEVTARIEAGEDVSIKEIQRLKQEQALMEIELDDAKNQLKNIPIMSDQYLKQSIKLTEVQVALNEREKMQEQIIDAKVNEERAKLLLENSAAIQRKQKEVDDAMDKLNALESKLSDAKKEQEKAIKDGIAREISSREIEVKQLDYQIRSLKNEVGELRESACLLDKQHGALKTHQESIKTIKLAVTDIRLAVELAQDDITPVELMNDWQEVNFALISLSKRLSVFCNRGVHSVVVEGQLLESIN
jgi:chromosome segregation ATPase